MSKRSKLISIPALLMSVAILIFTQLVESVSGGNAIISVLYLSVGIYTLFQIGRKFKNIINPIGLYTLVWCIFIPVTSFSFPIMPEMSLSQWRYISIFNICFYLSAFIINYIFPMNKLNTDKIRKVRLTLAQYIFLIATLMVSIFTFFILATIAGGFPSQLDNPDLGRTTFFSISGSSTVSMLGMLSIFFILLDEKFRIKKMFWILVIIYLVTLYLMAVRFGIMVLLLMMLSVLSLQKLTKKQVELIVLSGIGTIVIFMAIANVRGGNVDKYAFFASYGYYSGSETWLQQSEFLRYIGYSQRLMERYLNFIPGSNHGQYTLMGFFPFLVNQQNFTEHLSILGYTATNMISYLYLDFGNFWILFAFIWGILVNLAFENLWKNSDNIIVRYLWTLSTISIVFSFFAYLHSYTTWIGNFIAFSIIVYIIGKINFRTKGI